MKNKNNTNLIAKSKSKTTVGAYMYNHYAENL